jgi:hypothetical protein
MHKYIIKGIITACLLCSGLVGYGQATNSPFSRLGIGDLVDPSLVNNQGMGGIGISNGSFWYLNNKNPALLPYNRLTVFSAGYVGEYKEYQDSVGSETTAGGNLNYLILAFPVKPNIWTTSVGLRPYSYIDYQQSSFETVNGSPLDTALVSEEGFGGINQFYWSNGFRLNQNFNVGLKVAYMFGSVNSEFSNTVLTSETLSNFTPTVSTEISVRDFQIGVGVSYIKDSIFNSGVSIALGATYDFASDLNAEKFQTYERRIRDQPTSRDTLVNNSDGTIYIPGALGLGISFSKGTKWMAGMDVSMQKWSEFKNYDGETLGFKDTFRIGVGAEITPDASSVNNYLKRVSYRFGFNYETMPYVPRTATGEQVKDFGINFGWSLPVSRYSSIDMAFKIGQRGNIDDNYLKENYFRVYLGFTFNDQWFIKRKYD